MKRRKAFSYGFTGQKHFKILDEILEKCLHDLLNKIQQVGEDKVHDLRTYLRDMFEQVNTMYLFGRDVSKDKVTIKVKKPDGNIATENQYLFKAIQTALT